MSNPNFTNFRDGIEIVPKTTSTVANQGQFDITLSDGKIHYHNGTISSPLVTEAGTATLTNKTIDISTNTVTNITNTNISASAAIDATKIANGSVSNTEFQFLDGATSNIQTQLNTLSGSGITSLTGDVSATGPGAAAATVNSVGGSSAANIHSAELLANAATSSNTASTIVKRDASKNFHLSGLQLDGSTSGTLTQNAADTTSSYTVKWPGSQGSVSQVLTNDGSGNLSWSTPASTGANTALSNLTSTSINQSLIPTTDATISLGTTSKRWDQLFTDSKIEVGVGTTLALRSSTTAPDGTTSAGLSEEDNLLPLSLTTASNSANNSTATTNILIESGNKTAGTGNSGNIIVQTGTSTGGSRGGITLNGNGITLNQISTPSNPSANFDKIYFKSNNLAYSLDSSGNENYIGYEQAVMILDEQSSAPSSPSAGHLKFYAKTDNLLYFKNPSGVENLLSSTAVKQRVFSSSSGAFTTTSSSPVSVTNMSVNVTNSGAALFKISFVTDGSGNNSRIGASILGGSTTAKGNYFIKRNGTVIGNYECGGVASSIQVYAPSSSIIVIDRTPDSGSNTYTLEASESDNGAGATAYFQYALMVVEEL